MELQEFEKKSLDLFKKSNSKNMSMDEAVKNYGNGNYRLITETGRFKPSQLAAMAIKSELPYQRNEVWSIEKRSSLMESLIMNIPIPPLLLYEYTINKYEVIDGKQRLNAIKGFINDEYPLAGLNFWSALEGKKYSEFPPTFANSIERIFIPVIVILQESNNSHFRDNHQMVSEIFRRVNSGEPLKPQEIRNAVLDKNNGVQDFIKSIVEDARFLEYIYENDVTQKEKKDIRKENEEIVLRFFMYRYEEYTKGKNQEIKLDETYQILDEMRENFEKLKDFYFETLAKVKNIFQEACFKQFNSNKKEFQKNFSRVMYDTHCIVAMKVSNQNFNIENYKKLVEAERDLFNIKNNTISKTLERADKIISMMNE